MHTIKGCIHVGYYKHVILERLATLNADCLSPNLLKVLCQCVFVTVIEKKCLTSCWGLAFPAKVAELVKFVLHGRFSHVSLTCWMFGAEQDILVTSKGCTFSYEKLVLSVLPTASSQNSLMFLFVVYRP